MYKAISKKRHAAEKEKERFQVNASNNGFLQPADAGIRVDSTKGKKIKSDLNN